MSYRLDMNVFDLFEYDYRTSIIRNTNGEVVFEMNNVEVPRQWSQIATDILAQKYFRKAGVLQADGSTKPEPTMDAKHVVDAVVHMASLPLDVNVLFMTVMANEMPFIGRG